MNITLKVRYVITDILVKVEAKLWSHVKIGDTITVTHTVSKYGNVVPKYIVLCNNVSVEYGQYRLTAFLSHFELEERCTT